MPKRISVDAVLADTLPYVQFRGVDYVLREWTVKDRLLRLAAARDAQEALTAVPEEGEEGEVDEAESAQEVQEIYARALTDALIDFPNEVAMTVTEREFSALQKAINLARNMVLPNPEAEEVKEEDLKRIGSAVTG